MKMKMRKRVMAAILVGCLSLSVLVPSQAVYAADEETSESTEEVGEAKETESEEWDSSKETEDLSEKMDEEIPVSMEEPEEEPENAIDSMDEEPTEAEEISTESLENEAVMDSEDETFSEEQETLESIDEENSLDEIDNSETVERIDTEESDLLNASAPLGIKGNGTGGISIDINASPYADNKAKPYGEYAYTAFGCAWFATSRVSQLTGKNFAIYDGQSWWDDDLRTGWSRGTEISAPAILCWSGHVAILEKIEGNTAYISEGGSSYYSDSNHGFCVIRTCSLSQVKNISNSSFLGFVYIPVNNSNPVTAFDVLQSGAGWIRVTGWAYDLDNPNESLDIHVYVGGAAGSGARNYPIKANNLRKDVGIGNCLHGFDAIIPVSERGENDVYVYAINVGAGDNTFAGVKHANILEPNPIGAFDALTSESANYIRVLGWAYDLSSPNTSLDIHVYVGGEAGSGARNYPIKANVNRPDVPVGNNLHGFDSYIKVEESGINDVYVYAINVDYGENVLLGKKTVTIAEADTDVTADSGEMVSGTCGENATWSFSDGMLTIGGYGAMYDYEELGQRPWNNLAYYIKSVAVSEGITHIGENAFYNLYRTESLSFPSSLKTIGDNACLGCRKLVDIRLMDGITMIGERAFNHCDELERISIPGSVSSIGIYAFSYCKKLQSVSFDDDGDVSAISDYTFIYCDSLMDISLPHNLSEIGKNAFYHCVSLEHIDLPSKLTKIGERAFQGCEKLATMIIPYGVTIIEIGAFKDCSALSAITIPASVTRIVGFAFSGCSSLSDVYYTGSKQSWQNVSIGSNDSNYLLSATMHYLETETPMTTKDEQSFTVHYNKYICLGRSDGVRISGAKTKLTYSSSNTSVAVISSTGIITPKKIGKTVITVTAAETDRYYGAYSNLEISVVPTVTKSVSMSNEANGIKLSWEKVSGAAGYYVYRNDKRIAQIKSGKTTSYIDKKAVSFENYTYKISAYAASGESTLCKQNTICRVPQTAITSISQNAGTVKVSWKKQSKSSGYELHYSLNFKKGYNTVRVTSAKKAYAIIKKMNRNKKYSFRIRAYKKVKNITYYSAWSQVKAKKLK